MAFVPDFIKKLDFLTQSEKEWLVENTNYFSLGDISKNDDGSINCNQLNLNEDVTTINGIKFGTVKELTVHGTKLYNLKNGPRVAHTVSLRNLQKLNTLVGFPHIADDVTVLNCPVLTSLVGMCETVTKLHLEDLPKITSLKGMPKNILNDNYFAIKNVPIKSFSRVNEDLHTFGVKSKFMFYAPLGTEEIVTPVLSFLFIKNIDKVYVFNVPDDSGIDQATKVINSILSSTNDPSHYVGECYEELCKRGLSEYARF